MKRPQPVSRPGPLLLSPSRAKPGKILIYIGAACAAFNSKGSSSSKGIRPSKGHTASRDSQTRDHVLDGLYSSGSTDKPCSSRRVDKRV